MTSLPSSIPPPPDGYDKADPVRVRLLGQVAVLDPAGGHVELGGPIAAAMLAALLMAGPVGMQLAALIEAVWGGPGAASRDSVYHYIGMVRAALARAGVPARIASRRPGYRLDITDDLVDWQRFRGHATAGRAAQIAGDAEAALGAYERALGLWSGPPLAGIGDRLAGHRQAMLHARHTVAEDAATCHLALGQPHQALDLLGPVTEEPISERAAALTMQALTALGRRDEAGAVYRQTRAWLADQLGLDPGPELTAAYQQTLETAASTTPAGIATTPAESGSPIVAGLPRPASHFTGRSTLLDQIATAMSDPQGQRIYILHGMGGIGKTSLAVHAARRLATAFPGGCLYLDLHGHTPNVPPVSVGEALDRLLRRLGVPGSRIPDHPDDRIAVYRDQLAGRRLLLVLDNAYDAAQVRPLLPTSVDCGALITSRRTLAALDDAHTLTIGTLASTDAATLFRAVAGAHRLATERTPAPVAQHTIDRIVERCGYLPLAIRIAAARYRSDSTLTLPALAAGLAAGADELSDGDRAISSTLATSLTDLPPASRTCLLQLALHPTTGFDRHAAQAIAADPNISRHLATLTDRHLLEQPAPSRYQFHDLIADLSRRHAHHEMPDAERTAVAARIVDYYLAAADRADQRLAPGRYRPAVTLTHPAPQLPDLAGYRQALGWFTDHDATIVAVCRTALDHELDTACWQLAHVAREYYYTTKRLQPWHDTHQLALRAARRLGDRHAEALTLNNLGLAALEAGDTGTAADRYQQALTLFRAQGDAHGEHTALANQAWIDYETGHYETFLAGMRTVLAFYETTGATRNAAITLRGIALAETRLNRTGSAISHLRHALALAEQLQLPLDAAMALNALGEAYREAGYLDQAHQAHRQALTYADQAGSVSERARAHHRLGDLTAADAPEVARRHWSQALADYLAVSDPRSDRISARLND